MSFLGLVRGAATEQRFRETLVSPALDEEGRPHRFVWFVKRAAGDWVPVDLRMAGDRWGATVPVVFFSSQFSDAWSLLGISAAMFLQGIGLERATSAPEPAAGAAAGSAGDPNVRRWWLDDSD